MKAASKISLFLGIALFSSAAVLNAAPPTAPAEYLAMENTFDLDDVDRKWLKKAGKIYKRKCKKCHGTDGDGEGSAAADMTLKPTAFNAPGYMEGKKDGQLFYIIKEGSPDTEMKNFGPGSDVNLSPEEIWKVITHMRSKFTN